MNVSINFALISGSEGMVIRWQVSIEVDFSGCAGFDAVRCIRWKRLGSLGLLGSSVLLSLLGLLCLSGSFGSLLIT